MNFRTTPVYQNAYATTRNIMQGKLKAAAREHAQMCKQGIANPSQTKLINRVAMFDAFGDYALEKIDSKDFGPKLVWKYIKNALKVNIFHRKEFKTDSRAFDKRYKELYPKTHKMRDKLISKGKVKLEHKFDTKSLELRKEAAQEIFFNDKK